MEWPSRRRIAGGIAFTALLGATGYFGQGRIHMGSSQREPKSAAKQSFVPATAPTVKDSTVDEVVHLNSATAEELQALPGIGPTLSKRIVDYRSANGPFKSVDDLQQVSGIGSKLFGKISRWLAL